MDRPALAVIENSLRIAPLAVLGAAICVVGLTRRGRRPTTGAALTLAAVAAAWVLLVAAMSEFGFSGVDRYLFAPLGVACVLAGVGFAGVLAAVVRPGRWRWLRVAGLLLATAPVLGVVISRLDGEYPLVDQLTHEAAVIDELPTVIERAGGERALDACGPLYASFHATASIAWTLGRHLEEVSHFARPPGTVMRARVLLDQPVDPPLNAMDGGSRRELARTRHWHVEAAC